MPRGHFNHKSGKESSHWLGDKVGKIGVHLWLRREYGTPTKCEHCGTIDEKKTYDWACRDKSYRRDRKNFMRLCRSCHRKYDYAHNGQNISEEARKKIGAFHKGKKWSLKYEDKPCAWCKKLFHPRNDDRKCCSRHCAMKLRYNKPIESL